ncbi:MAG: RnfABCDGE type electron transport complex subunit D [Treponema sp.]|jgi:electron transport complex protein RnfD|nr:RnfABCDGE type electron transport complex subunit D [Treponema sp.]
MSDPDILLSQIKLGRRPLIHLSCPTAGRMGAAGGCAALGILQSSLTDSGYSLLLALTACAAAVLTEWIGNLNQKPFSPRDGSAVTSALVFTLLLPHHLHPLLAAAGMVFAMGVVKRSFGGLGANWLNPALGAWLFVRLAWPGAFTQALDPASWGAPVAGFSGEVAGRFNAFDGPLTAWLNRTVFSLAGAELPEGYLGLLVYTGNGAVAERGLLGLILGSIILIGMRVNRFWMSALFLGVYALLVRLFGDRSGGGSLGAGDVLGALFSGSVITAAFLMITDPATGPKSRIGAGFAAAAAGLGAFFFQYRGLEPYGAYYAVGLMNALVPLIRDFECRGWYAGGLGHEV